MSSIVIFTKKQQLQNLIPSCVDVMLRRSAFGFRFVEGTSPLLLQGFNVRRVSKFLDPELLKKKATPPCKMSRIA
jgi:hypothetical protein